MKNAILFTIDSLLASGIVIITILLISNFYTVEEQKGSINYVPQDLLLDYSSITIGQVNNDYAKSLVSSGAITNVNNTVLEQIGYFWSSGSTDLAANLAKNLTEGIIPKNYGYSVLADGQSIYTRNATMKSGLVSSRMMVSGLSGMSNFWGPIIVEIRVWQ